MRTLAALLMRSMFLQLEKKVQSEVDTDTLKQCQAELLLAIETEADLLIQRNICDAVAELARSCVGKSQHYKPVLALLCLTHCHCKSHTVNLEIFVVKYFRSR